MRINNFLEDLYFHELEIREKIFSRLQINIGAHLTIITAIAYMVRTIDYSSSTLLIFIFYALIVLSIISLIFSIVYTGIAFTGYEYQLFPFAADSVKYKREAESYFRELDIAAANAEYFSNEHNLPASPTVMVNDYILDSLAECIDKNSKINEQRRTVNKKSIFSLAIAFIPFIFCSCLFVILDLDTSSPRKNLAIEDAKLRISMEHSIDEIKKSLDNLTKDTEIMATNNNHQGEGSTNNSPPPTTTPAPQKYVPPPLPKRPPLRISNESFTDPLPDKSKLLNEGK